MHRDGDARHEETRRARRRSTKPSEEPRRSNPRRKVTCRGGHGALSLSLPLSLSLSLLVSARSRAVSVARRDRDRDQGSGRERRIGPRSSSRGDAAAPPRHYSYVPVPQLRSLSIPWLLAGRGEGARSGAGGRGGLGKRGAGGGGGGGGGGSGSGGGQKGDGGQEEEEEEEAGAAEFPLKTQTRPRMHARCNPMVCIRYARRYPPRGKRLLHRAINV